MKRKMKRVRFVGEWTGDKRFGTVAQRVRRGGKHLDARFTKEWPAMINLDKFDVSDARYCLIGYCAGSYFGNSGETDRFLGFMPFGRNGGVRLTKAWKMYILNLRKRRGLSGPEVQEEEQSNG